MHTHTNKVHLRASSTIRLASRSASNMAAIPGVTLDADGVDWWPLVGVIADAGTGSLFSCIGM